VTALLVVSLAIVQRKCLILIILGSVANGFVLPLKEEHALFFLNTLLPLYRRYFALHALFVTRTHPSPPFSCSLPRFSAPLTCISRTFMMKDATLSHAVVKYLLRYWPVSSSEKVLVFLSTLKDAIILLTTSEAMEPACLKELMTRLRACMGR
jgi:serine/threonine-protein phosphatase 2A regulatory subunit B'